MSLSRVYLTLYYSAPHNFWEGTCTCRVTYSKLPISCSFTPYYMLCRDLQLLYFCHTLIQKAFVRTRGAVACVPFVCRFLSSSFVPAKTWWKRFFTKWFTRFSSSRPTTATATVFLSRPCDFFVWFDIYMVTLIQVMCVILNLTCVLSWNFFKCKYVATFPSSYLRSRTRVSKAHESH